jgi:hypothetical protein
LRFSPIERHFNSLVHLHGEVNGVAIGKKRDLNGAFAALLP